MFALQLVPVSELIPEFITQLNRLTADTLQQPQRFEHLHGQRSEQLQAARKADSDNRVRHGCNTIITCCVGHVRHMAIAAAKQLSEQSNQQLGMDIDIDTSNNNTDSDDDSDDKNTDDVSTYLVNWAKILTAHIYNTWCSDAALQRARTTLIIKYQTAESAEAVDAFVASVAAVTERVLVGIVNELTAQAQGMVDDP